MAFPFSFSRKAKDRGRRRDDRRHANASEAVRSHLDRVEIGSPLLYPF